ncbi:putative homeodomain transcription factor [Leptinotarsa decemlineata]|uniref:putative homeodomain transcription factor n=1 Tax=Leptinotarsa decemlineata TaxID=7539 RepID=UPI003D30D003
MGINHIFTWYQQKIGTYDKQKWETRIEQREQLKYGLNHIKTRSAKPNNDLIDLDLVRGSSFTKTKPKHGFIKVTQLATLRLMFLPLYRKWWIEQTSRYVFGISLILYFLQVINIIVCLFKTPINDTSHDALSYMEILIPQIMMWVLSLIHSQIVATSPNTEMKTAQLKHVHYRRRKHISDLKKRRVKNQESSRMKSTRNGKVLPMVDISEVDSKSGVSDTTKTISDVYEKNSADNHIRNAVHGSCSSDSDTDVKPNLKPKRKSLSSSRTIRIPTISIRDTNVDSDDEILSSPEIRQSEGLMDDIFSTDWMGVTTNSEDCSYSSDLENISDSEVENDMDSSMFDTDSAPTDMLTPSANKVSCIIWERNEIKKADLSMLDISSAIICKVDSMPESMDYFYFGIVLSTAIALLPVICRLVNSSSEANLLDAHRLVEDIYANVTTSVMKDHDSVVVFYHHLLKEILRRFGSCVFSAFDGDSREYVVMTISSIQRWILASTIFFLLAVAEKTFKQRLLYAKLFSHLTSSRRAKKSDIPHFRLNKVLNIKTWLSVRSYLKKRGPQRSVDVIVSTAFVANLLLLTFLCVEVLKDTVFFSQYYLEALIWCIGLGILLLRFMTLGTKINKKYRNLSVLITEQINLHLQIEQISHKKDELNVSQKKEELNVSNNVLKLAIDLLKELENPFKISGLSANPILYNCTKLVILSALSGVLSEMLGFKLKLHKIKLK